MDEIAWKPELQVQMPKSAFKAYPSVGKHVRDIEVNRSYCGYAGIFRSQHLKPKVWQGVGFLSDWHFVAGVAAAY